MLPRGHPLLFAHALFRPDQRRVVVTGKRLDPVLILLATLAQQFLGQLGVAANIPEEINDGGSPLEASILRV
jgi:hypothetical protein